MAKSILLGANGETANLVPRRRRVGGGGGRVGVGWGRVLPS